MDVQSWLMPILASTERVPKGLVILQTGSCVKHALLVAASRQVLLWVRRFNLFSRDLLNDPSATLALLAHDSPTSEKDRAKPVETGGRGSRC